jgi:hypothetical protein
VKRRIGEEENRRRGESEYVSGDIIRNQNKIGKPWLKRNFHLMMQ